MTVATEEPVDLSFRAWATTHLERKGKVGNYARWYVAGARGDPPPYSEAVAEYQAFLAEHRPTANEIAERLAVEASRRPEPDPVPDVPLAVALAGAVSEIRELVDELLGAAAMSEGRRDRLRRTTLKRLDDRLAQLRKVAHRI